jgi:2-polyprenyl-6-methoxyphenol hydroxylase-like FAD-dependent oxidoreductase
MTNGSDLYFDRVSQIRLDHWVRGRTALVGDAAACVSLLAGEGSGLAGIGGAIRILIRAENRSRHRIP